MAVVKRNFPNGEATEDEVKMDQQGLRYLLDMIWTKQLTTVKSVLLPKVSYSFAVAPIRSKPR